MQFALRVPAVPLPEMSTAVPTRAVLIPDIRKGEVEAWFEFWDRDGSGSLERREVLVGLLTSCGCDPSDADPDPTGLAFAIRRIVASVYPMFDRDGDGSLSKFEFMSKGGFAQQVLRRLPAV